MQNHQRLANICNILQLRNVEALIFGLQETIIIYYTDYQLQLTNSGIIYAKKPLYNVS